MYFASGEIFTSPSSSLPETRTRPVCDFKLYQAIAFGPSNSNASLLGDHWYCEGAWRPAPVACDCVLAGAGKIDSSLSEEIRTERSPVEGSSDASSVFASLPVPWVSR